MQLSSDTTAFRKFLWQRISIRSSLMACARSAHNSCVSMCGLSIASCRKSPNSHAAHRAPPSCSIISARRGVGPYAGRREEVLAHCRTELRAFAAFNSARRLDWITHIKLSCVGGWPDHIRISSRNSEAGSTLATSKWSLARVQAT